MPTCPSPAAAAAAAAAAWNCPNATLPADATLIYVAPTGQDNAACGLSASSPCQTLGQGLAQCTGSSCAVLAYYGVYSPTSSVALASNRSLYGGCLAGTAADTNFSIVNAPPGGVPAIIADGVTGSTLQGLSIVGSAVAASPAIGAPSVAVAISGNSNVTLTDVGVTGGTGGNGAAGGGGAAAVAGGGASGGTGGVNAKCSTAGGTGGQAMGAHMDYGFSSVTGCTTICGAIQQTNTNCSGGSCSGPYVQNCNGGWGATPGGAAGGAGGGGSRATCVFACSASPLGGVGGSAGSSGACGASGAASTEIAGTYVNGVWTASLSASGVAGGNGAGGGGGGGGQASATNCMWVQTDKGGGAGGGGGAGACGATPGAGGQQGGASIGISVVQSTVTLNAVKIVGGSGGPGGDGGSGAGAAAGGAGASGGSGSASHGASGGNGGWGGASGGGAGGDGGPSIGIAFVGAAEASVGTTTFYEGYSGGVGKGGGVVNVAGAPCQSSGAAWGVPGRVVDYISFN